MEKVDLTNHRFGRLTVLSRAERRGETTYWLCRCDCGVLHTAAHGCLRKGHTKSCGCLRRDTTTARLTKHGQAVVGKMTPEYEAWQGLKRRCQNPKNSHYKHYGGRGITVCAEWNASFEAFFADMGKKPSPRHSIERVDLNGNYEKANCVWATPKEQANNTNRNHWITFEGRTMTMAQWSEHTGIPPRCLERRLNRSGWDVERALTEPLRVWPGRK